MSDNLAGSSTYGPQTPFLLHAGDCPVTTDAAPALADIDQYEICALTATGVTPFVVGTHTIDQVVIAAEDAVSGAQCPYYNGGYFNHEALVWPADASLDTYAERKAWLVNRTIKIGHITNAVSSS